MWSLRLASAVGWSRAKCAAPLMRQIVGFGRARGEDDLARVGADQAGDLAARRVDRRHRVLAVDWLSLCGLPKCSVK